MKALGRAWLAYRLTDRLSRRTTAVSQAAADRFVRLKAVPVRKCSVLTNGIDIAEFTPSPERRVRARAEMGVQEGVRLAGGWTHRARQGLSQPVARLFIGSRCSSGCAPLDCGRSLGSEAARVQALAVEHGLGEAVRWLGLRRDMPALLDAADGFVLASSWEGMPLVVGEAMAMEKPVVATDVGGVRELVGESGVIVPAKSPESLRGRCWP